MHAEIIKVIMSNNIAPLSKSHLQAASFVLPAILGTRGVHIGCTKPRGAIRKYWVIVFLAGNAALVS
jgi:hypothetical protein